MQYEMVPANQLEDEWLVQAVNREGDGEMYSAVFYGQDSRERAKEYLDWKNAAVVASRAPASAAR
jgi:hypothetical protein